MQVFQIVLVGPTVVFDERGKIRSKVLYRTKERAEANIETMKIKATTRVTDPTDFATLERVDEVHIIELEVEDY